MRAPDGKNLSPLQKISVGGYAAPRVRSMKPRKVYVVDKAGAVIRETNTRKLALAQLAAEDVEFGVGPAVGPPPLIAGSPEWEGVATKIVAMLGREPSLLFLVRAIAAGVAQ